MTDRRRNLFILLLVAGLLLARRSSSSRRSRRAWASTSRAASRSSTRPSRRKQSPGHQRRRSTARSTSCASASTSSASPSRRSSARAPTRSSSRCPDVKNADAGGQPGRHDGAAVLLRLGAERPRPRLQAGRRTNAERHRRPGGRQRLGPRAIATTTRSCAPPTARATNTDKDDRTTASTTCVDTKTKKVLAGPQETRGRPAARSAEQQGARSPTRPRSSRSSRARSSSSAERRRRQGRATPDALLRPAATTPALRGTDIKNPEQNFDQRRRRHRRSRSSRSTSPTRAARPGRTTTREIAQRGSENSSPAATPATAFQHFAIVLDDELISAPYIDFQQNPDGIDGAQRLADRGRLHDQVRPATSRTC